MRLIDYIKNHYEIVLMLWIVFIFIQQMAARLKTLKRK